MRQRERCEQRDVYVYIYACIKWYIGIYIHAEDIYIYTYRYSSKGICLLIYYVTSGMIQNQLDTDMETTVCPASCVCFLQLPTSDGKLQTLNPEA